MKRSTQTFLALCAGQLLLAMAASAGPSDDSYESESADTSPVPAPTVGDGAPAPSYDAPTYELVDTPAPAPVVDEEEMEEAEKRGTPAPVDIEATSAPTEYYMETTSEGGMEKTPDEPLNDDETPEEEEMPMDNPADGASCSIYDETVHAAHMLPEMCEYNTYMCCWTGHDGQDPMYGNTDVCRVFDYPDEGNDLEFPRDSEGPVYCHGFAWEDGADVDAVILPLYYYVKNVNRTEDGGGYHGKYNGDGIAPCWDNSLRAQYKYNLDEPNGELEQLVYKCDNQDVPDYDFRTCEHNTYMCCWTENDGKGMADNTDVCYVGDTGYPGESEGEVHCHGFVWPEDATDKYIHLLAQFVQHFDHRDNRGYYGNLPDAPMCGCIEDMPIVSEADCTTYDDEPGREGKFTACTNNDLRTAFEEEFPGVPVPNLVEECDNEEG
eukprot:g11187.t1